MSFDMNTRDIPESYIRKALEKFKESGGQTIVELGCMRQPMDHAILKCSEKCNSRCDGHSTAIFDSVGVVFVSVDISEAACKCARAHVWHPSTTIKCMDAIEYLKKCPIKIDLLYLDAWDVDLDDCAEKHLEAYEVGKHLLHDKSIVLIDDTDVVWFEGEFHPVFSKDAYAGKGELVVPAMIKDGWKVAFTGRQTMLVKG